MLGHDKIESSMVDLQMDLPRRRKILRRFTGYTQAVLSRNAQIEALIDEEEEEDILERNGSVESRYDNDIMIKNIRCSMIACILCAFSRIG